MGAATAFPHSTVVFDHFHVIQVLHTALEKVRRAETKRQPALKRTRALWLQNPERLTPAQQTKLARLREIAVETARAYDWMQAVAQIWEAADREAGERCLEECLGVVDASYPRVLRTAAQTLRRHRDGILAYFEHRITNGLLEGLASLIQATKARARGFRTQRFFAGVIYLMHGNLPLPQAR